MIPSGHCEAWDLHSFILRKYVSFFSSISPEGLPRKCHVSCVVPPSMSFLISPNLRFPQKLQYALVFYQKCRSFWFPESTPCLLRELFQTVTKLSQQLQTPNCLCPLSLGLLPSTLWSFIFSSPHSVFSLMCASCLHLSFHTNLLQI